MVQGLHKAKEMCGAPGTQKRMPPERENRISGLAGAPGLRADGTFHEGHTLSDEDVYLAVPRLKGGSPVAS